MSGCGGCTRARAYLPEAIRSRLEALERRMEARKTPTITIEYNVKPRLARTDSPQPLPTIPSGGDSAGGGPE